VLRSFQGNPLFLEKCFYRRQPLIHETTDFFLRKCIDQFIAIARSEAVPMGPYEEILRRPGSFRRKAKKKKK